MSEVVGKIFKIIKILLIGVIILSVLSLAGYFGYQWYSTHFWTAPEKLDGISLGMSRSDVFFYKGKDASYEPENNFHDSRSIIISEPKYSFSDNKIQSLLLTFDENDRVEYMSLLNLDYDPDWNIKIPFSKTSELLNLFGDPDIYSESENETEKYRNYTYLKQGYTFNFSYDNLVSFAMGKVTWRGGWGKTTKYVVKGKQVCPSSDCPWDDEDNLKEEFKDKDYRYFLNK